MSAISSNVGLISGLPINDLVNSLIAAQSGPLSQLQNRVQTIGATRSAYLQLSASLLSIRNAAGSLKLPTLFTRTSAVTSNESILQATSSAATPNGEFTFTVRNLASAQQLISTGFANSNSAPVGTGTITLETASGVVNQSTRLSRLNGGTGVQVGSIRVTDKAGNQSRIDLVTAKTLDDVVEAINNDSVIGVRASVRGDRLVIEDTSGGAGSLSVSDVGSGRTATDLGIVGSTTGSTLDGRNLVFLTESTRLAALNDGNGVRTRPIGGNDIRFNLSNGTNFEVKFSADLENDTPLAVLNSGNGIGEGVIRITNRAGVSEEIDISGANNIGEVIDLINTTAGLNVEARLNAGRLIVKDNSLTQDQIDDDLDVSEFIIEDVTGTVADSLGLVNNTSGSEITGQDIYRIDSVGDLLRAINLDPENQGRLTASISADGLGIQLVDNTGGGAVSVEALGGSKSAQDLGLILGTANGSELRSTRLLSGLNTVLVRSLNGGQGVDRSGLSITDANGNTQAIDISGAVTLEDIIASINNAGVGVKASVSSSGLGISLRDTTTPTGTANFTVSGISAVSLGIDGASNGGVLKGRNLQRQYVSAATRLEDFNNGKGVPRGKFTITNSLGQSATVDLTQGDERTIQDVIDEINSRPIDVEARINDTGDGIAIVDLAGGTLQLKVEEEGGTTARALNILGTAKLGFDFIDGSFEKRIETSAGDSLDDVARKIREAKAGVSVAVVNDGSGLRPYRLSITGQRTGLEGAIAIDGGTTSLGFETIVRAQDATVIYGPGGGDNPFVISSSTNTLDGAVAGLSINLVQASTEPVTISVSDDREAIFTDVKKFIDSYNKVIDFLNDATDFNPETEERGILQADGTARRVRNTLTSLFSRNVPGLNASVNSFSDVGIRLGAGGKLELNEDRLRSAIEADPEGVTELFTLEEKDSDGNVIRRGLASRIQEEIDQLTDPESGAITLRDGSLQTSEQQINNRIAALESLLESRRDRLLAQFQNMEAVIAQLQSQQSALAGLGQIQGLSA